MGELVASGVAVALVPEELLQLLHAVVPGGIELEEGPDHLRLGLVDHKSPAVLAVAEDAAVAQDDTLPDGLLVAKADAAGELAQLILGDGGHDSKPQLSVLVQRIDVVILEEDRNPGG